MANAIIREQTLLASGNETLRAGRSTFFCDARKLDPSSIESIRESIKPRH
jgi:hypothetical protein